MGDTERPGERAQAELLARMARDVGDETVVEEAQRLVYGPRADDYGDALEEAEKVAAGWSILIGAPVSPEMYPRCMAWLKLVRQTNRAKRDNLVDQAGYAAVEEKIQRCRERREVGA